MEKMKKEITINVPDIGDFEKIPVIIEAGTPGDQSGVYSDTRNMFSVFGPRKLVSLDEGLKKIVVRESYNI